MKIVGIVLRSKYEDALETLRKMPCTTVLVDCRYVPTLRTLEVVYDLAKRGWEQGFARARNFAVEFLRWYSGRKQIRDAIEVGFKPEHRSYVAIVECEEALEALKQHFEIVEDVESLIEECFDLELTKRFYNITEEELRCSQGGSVREKVERSIISRSNTLFLD